jgi:hypothetical protein
LFSFALPSFLGGRKAQDPRDCLASAQFEAALVNNAGSEVTFGCRDATSLELIESVGRQTRIPIGIVLGKDPDLLSKTKQSYRLFDVDAKSALLEAVTGTGYTVSESDDGFVLTAGDLTSRQSQVLRQKLVDFRAGSNVTMVEREPAHHVAAKRGRSSPELCSKYSVLNQ